MQTETGFNPRGDRYIYDFHICKSANGWAQMDTTQDASYYGNWLNPITREFRSYAEGDTKHVRFDTDEEMIEYVREFVRWNEGNGYWIGLDTMCSPQITTRVEELGLSDIRHKSDQLREAQ